MHGNKDCKFVEDNKFLFVEISFLRLLEGALKCKKGSFLLTLGNFVFHFSTFSLQANISGKFFFQSNIDIYM
jgi:hypothetical protein